MEFATDSLLCTSIEDMREITKMMRKRTKVERLRDKMPEKKSYTIWETACQQERQKKPTNMWIIIWRWIFMSPVRLHNWRHHTSESRVCRYPCLDLWPCVFIRDSTWTSLISTRPTATESSLYTLTHKCWCVHSFKIDIPTWYRTFVPTQV